MNNKKDIFIFCENVKSLRKRKKLSKKEMAKLIGVSIRTINLIEKGIVPQKLNVNVVFEIYRVFYIKPADMFSKLI